MPSQARVTSVSHHGQGTIETPNCFLYTKAGYPPGISDDLFPELAESPVLLHHALADFYDNLSVISSHYRDLSHFLGLTGSDGKLHRGVPTVNVLSCLDLLSPVTLPSSDTEFSFDSQSGRKKLTAGRYVEIIEQLRPSLAIQPFPEVTAFSQKKRTGKSVSHTTVFARDCLKQLQVKGADQPEAFSSFWPAIGGGIDPKARQLSLQDFQTTYEQYSNLIGGVFLSGFGVGETADQRTTLLRQIVESLPPQLPRFLSGLGDPVEILCAVEEGVDLFTSVYPYVIAESGLAFNFALDLNGSPRQATLNLRDGLYQKDWRAICGKPVSQGESSKIDSSLSAEVDAFDCTCYCCRKHTRAYLNHLLHTHELLGHVLLNIHNSHHYLQFFKAIRSHIKAGTFETFKSWFVAQWQEENK